VNAGGTTVQVQNLGWGGQHLANALKYATAFPVTVLSAFQHAEGGLGMSETGLYNLWYVCTRRRERSKSSPRGIMPYLKTNIYVCLF